jgi:ABC-type nitrate/sulfonate/bicarbonate transport system substrate-binding protein
MAVVCAAGSAQARDLCVQLKWVHQSQFAGFYLAAEKGLYKSEGLEISFREGGPLTDWQETLADPSCPVGVTNAYEIVIARARGVPVRAVAAIDQASPIVWFTLAESPIHGPRQFKGRRVVVVPTGRVHFRGMLDAVGLYERDVTVVPFSFDLTPLYNGTVDVWSGYHTNLVTRAEREGHKVRIIHPINYGVQIYDDVIYVRDEMIAADRAAVLGFLRATLRGWREAVRNPGEAVSATLAFAPRADAGHEQTLFLRSIPYVHTGEVPIGWMDKAVWDDIRALTCASEGMLACPEAEAVFTDEFLREIYGKGSRP